MNPDPLICCAGRFGYVPFLDDALTKKFQIDTHFNDPPNSVSSASSSGFPLSRSSTLTYRDANFRVQPVKFPDDSVRRVAVSRYHKPYGVVLYEVESKCELLQCVGLVDSVFALGIVYTRGMGAGPRIVAGSGGAAQVVLFDGLTGEKISEFRFASYGAARVVHVPEWNENEVFIGATGKCTKYDLNRLAVETGRVDFAAGGVNGLVANVSQRLLYTIGRSAGRSSICVWSPEFPTVRVGDLSLSEPAKCCFYSEERRELVVGMDSGRLQVFDSRKLDHGMEGGLAHFSFDERVVIEVEGLRMGDGRFLCASDDGSLRIIDSMTGKELHKTTMEMRCDGLCVFDADEDGSDEEAIHDRFSFLVGFEFCPCVVVVHVADGSSILSCWRWMIN